MEERKMEMFVGVFNDRLIYDRPIKSVRGVIVFTLSRIRLNWASAGFMPHASIFSSHSDIKVAYTPVLLCRGIPRWATILILRRACGLSVQM